MCGRETMAVYLTLNQRGKSLCRFESCRPHQLSIVEIMPYKDPAKQREYQRMHYAGVRARWFEENGPCSECKSWIDLELHHRDPEKKISHKIWSWSKRRRDDELAKCDALCKSCHKKHTRRQKMALAAYVHGTRFMFDKKKCRCRACVDGNAERRKKYPSRRKTKDTKDASGAP